MKLIAGSALVSIALIALVTLALVAIALVLGPAHAADVADALNDLTGIGGGADGIAKDVAAELCADGGSHLETILALGASYVLANLATPLAALSDKVPWYVRPFVHVAAGNLLVIAKAKFEGKKPS